MIRATSAMCLLVLLFACGCSEPHVVTIATRPVPASIKIEGVDAGTAPVTHTYVFDGERSTYRVDVSRPGYKDQVIDVTKKTDPNVVVDLKPLTRKITVNVRPFPANLSLNG